MLTLFLTESIPLLHRCVFFHFLDNLGHKSCIVQYIFETLQENYEI